MKRGEMCRRKSKSVQTLAKLDAGTYGSDRRSQRVRGDLQPCRLWAQSDKVDGNFRRHVMSKANGCHRTTCISSYPHCYLSRKYSRNGFNCRPFGLQGFSCPSSSLPSQPPSLGNRRRRRSKGERTWIKRSEERCQT